MKETEDPIGLVGLGLVGSALAARLLERGYAVVGCDIDADKTRALEAGGGTAAPTPAAVADSCGRVVLSLMTSDIVRRVVSGPDGILRATRKPTVLIDTTTGDPEETTALAAELGSRGIAYLDATISGSSQQIRRGEGTFMVGGDAQALESNRALFACLTARLYHLGPAGSGSRAKLASNLVLGLNRLALAEGLVFAEKLGLDLEAFLGVLRDSPAYSAAVDTKGPKMLSGDFEPAARLRQHGKDVDLILEYARRAGLDLPLSAAHRGVLRAAVDAGDGDLDNSAVIRQLRRRGADAPRTYLGAYALCRDPSGRLLMARMAAGPDAGRWTLPGGGVEWGEAPEDTVRRELREETGITRILSCTPATTHSNTYARSAERPCDSVHHVGLVYEVRPGSFDLKPEEDGSTDGCAWFTEDEARALPLVPLAELAVDLAWPPGAKE